ncbi:hypothetical protein QE152_g15767 [Popillia japonica]|uniref:Uncharacterized protein n=1 Tax=Popillia japonica TaxID=7064 RepID=A0AAW1L4I8_POPJA
MPRFIVRAQVAATRKMNSRSAIYSNREEMPLVSLVKESGVVENKKTGWSKIVILLNVCNMFSVFVLNWCGSA